jgi:hypothetical protein
VGLHTRVGIFWFSHYFRIATTTEATVQL